MKSLPVKLINYYQRHISPKKGFNCAHHQAYQQGSCSEVIKQLIQTKGLVFAIPDIIKRFRDCKTAYLHLSTQRHISSYLPHSADLPCDIGIGDCGSGGAASSVSNNACYIPCDILSGFSRRTQTILCCFIIACLITGMYFLYGKKVDSVVLETTAIKPTHFLNRLTQRESPNIKVVLIAKGKKYYSTSIKLDKTKTQYTLSFANSPLIDNIDTLKILDARVEIGHDDLVVGQVLEEFPQAVKKAQGQRFSYTLRQKWSFF